MVWGDTHHCTRVSGRMSTSWFTTVGRIRAVVCPTNPTQVGIASRSIPAMKNTGLSGNEDVYTGRGNPCIFRLVWWKLDTFPRGAAVTRKMACSELSLTGPYSWELMMLGSVNIMVLVHSLVCVVVFYSCILTIVDYIDYKQGFYRHQIYPTLTNI